MPVEPLLTEYIERILRARVYDVAIETPLDRARQLSTRLNNRVWIKREDLQPVFSFKVRGAYNKIAGLDPVARQRGVVAASAGNHAQGVAISARELGIPALIVMPRMTAAIKVKAVRSLGAETELTGETLDEAFAAAIERSQQRGMTLIHPFDDPGVIAGQGTIGMEILRQHPDPIAAIFVCVGGGGLIAGIAAYVKYVRPETRIIGVEPDDAACLDRALAAGKPVALDYVGGFTDGAAVRQVGQETYRIAKQCVDEVITVTSDEICAAIKDIFDDTRTIAEPAGALGVAGLKRFVEREGLRDASLVAIESGANVNFDRLRHIAERAAIGELREALFAVQIPEQPGSFLAFCRTLGRRSITEFNYRFYDARNAQVFVGVELSEGNADRHEIASQLRANGYGVVDMTDDETAKLHIRYMVGGHAPEIHDERLVRFEFPEHPGALADFLSRMGRRWNISLFHYRNHGAAYGRVLMGVQTGDAADEELFDFLDGLGYPYQEDTANPAYQFFAGGGRPTTG